MKTLSNKKAEAVANDSASAALPSDQTLRRRRIRAPHEIVSIVVGLILWQLLVQKFAHNSLAVASPTQVVREFGHLVADGELWPNLKISLYSFALGYILCAVIAIPVGLLIGSSTLLARYTEPWIDIFYAIPKIALAPAVIIYLGFGVSAKVVIVAVECVFPMIVNAIAGVRTVGTDFREVGLTFQANRLETFTRIYLPAALPSILTGLRLAVGRGLVGVVVADLFGATAGLGLMLVSAAELFDTAQVFVVAGILGAIGWLLGSIIGRIERRVNRRRYK